MLSPGRHGNYYNSLYVSLVTQLIPSSIKKGTPRYIAERAQAQREVRWMVDAVMDWRKVAVEVGLSQRWSRFHSAVATHVWDTETQKYRKAVFKPRRSQERIEESGCICISPLPPSVTRDSIKSMLELYGSIAFIDIRSTQIPDERTAVIQFRSAMSARRARAMLQGSRVFEGSKPINVAYTKPIPHSFVLPSPTNEIPLVGREIKFATQTRLMASLSTDEQKQLAMWVKARAKGKPLQYILGTQPFAGINLALRKPILIPRPETEEWTLRLIQLIEASAANRFLRGIDNHLRILDLCGGTGCIGLALAYHLGVLSTIERNKLVRKQSISTRKADYSVDHVPFATLDHLTPYIPADPSNTNIRVDVVIADINPAAVRLARFNAHRLGLLSPLTRNPWAPALTSDSVHVRCVQADVTSSDDISMLARIPPPGVHASDDFHGYDIVVTNPPYITPKEYRKLDLSVKKWEDMIALKSGDPNGSALLRRIAEVCGSDLLRDDVLCGDKRKEVPRMVMEIGGSHQVEDVKASLNINAEELGKGGLKFKSTDVWRMHGVDRVVLAY